MDNWHETNKIIRFVLCFVIGPVVGYFIGRNKGRLWWGIAWGFTGPIGWAYISSWPGRCSFCKGDITRDASTCKYCGLKLHRQKTAVKREKSLLEAVKDNDISTAAKLLTRKADVNMKSEHGSSPLHFASREDNRPMIDLLLEHGAHIEAQDIDGDTPLHVAAYRGNIKTVEHLLSKGARKDVRNKAGASPSQIAQEQKYGNVVKVLEKTIDPVNKAES